MAKVRVFDKPYTSDSGKTYPEKIWVLDREKLIVLSWNGCKERLHLGRIYVDIIEQLESCATDTKEVEISDDLVNQLIANVEGRSTLLQEFRKLNLPAR